MAGQWFYTDADVLGGAQRIFPYLESWKSLNPHPKFTSTFIQNRLILWFWEIILQSALGQVWLNRVNFLRLTFYPGCNLLQFVSGPTIEVSTSIRKEHDITLYNTKIFIFQEWHIISRCLALKKNEAVQRLVMLLCWDNGCIIPCLYTIWHMWWTHWGRMQLELILFLGVLLFLFLF